MNDFVNLHNNTVDDKIFFENCISESTLFQPEDILGDEVKDPVLEIFNQTLSDTLCQNFDLLNQPVTSDLNYSDGFEEASSYVNNERYSNFKPDMKSFQMNKVWPDQLDILAGPLLEDDENTHNENDTMDDVSKINEKTSTSETALILNNAMTAGVIQFGTDEKNFHVDSIDWKTGGTEINGNKLGKVIRLSRVEDDDEEIDVVTVEEENVKGISKCNISNVNRDILNMGKYSTFTNSMSNSERKLLNVAESNINKVTVPIFQVKDTNEIVLEAPDVDSLLQQFEATQDFNPSEKEEEENMNKDDSTKLTNSSSKSAPKELPAASVIERIKSSKSQSRSTIMISHETILKSSSPNKLPLNNNTKITNTVPIKENMNFNKESENVDVINLHNDINSKISVPDNDCVVQADDFGNEIYYNKLPDYLTELKLFRRMNIGDKMQKTLKQVDSIGLNNNNMFTKDDCEMKFINNNSPVCCVKERQSFSIIVSSPSVVDTSLNSPANDISTPNSNLNGIGNFQLPEDTDTPHIVTNHSESSGFGSYLHSQISNDPDSRLLSLHNDRWRKYHCTSQNTSPDRSPIKYLPFRRSRSQSPYKKHKHIRDENYLKKAIFYEEQKEKIKQIEERRVVFIGDIPNEMTQTRLVEIFEKFGPIQEITCHSRDHGNSYGFVTYKDRNDAYQAVEHGNDDPSRPKFNLSFGGRRQFCKSRYSDLDSLYSVSKNNLQDQNNLDFDSLLKVVRAQQKVKSPEDQS